MAEKVQFQWDDPFFFEDQLEEDERLTRDSQFDPHTSIPSQLNFRVRVRRGWGILPQHNWSKMLQSQTWTIRKRSCDGILEACGIFQVSQHQTSDIGVQRG